VHVQDHLFGDVDAQAARLIGLSRTNKRTNPTSQETKT